MRAQNPCVRLRLAVQGLALMCVLLGTNADNSCKRGCPESDDGYLSYVPGNVYDYNFDSIMTVGINREAGNTEDTSLKVTGNAKLFAEGNCGYTLQLGAVKVTATKENVEKKIMQSIQKPIHFTMHSGKIEPELCADQGDNVYALNIKRAIISMFQSKPDAVQETDIFGQCPTHTTVSKIGNAEIVSKVRNLNICNYRRIINSGILTNAIQSKPGSDATSLLKADYVKESKIQNGVVSNVQLVEEYKYTELSISDSGIRAKVVTNLKLRNPAGSPVPAPATGARSVSIIFQKPDTYTTKNIAALKNSLTELVQQLDGYVKKDSAKGFTELIRLMRNSDTETLLELGAVPLPTKVLGRKVYLDALFRTATSESARAILKQFNKMNEKEKIIAAMSLNLVQAVDKDTLNQASNLLNANAIKEVYLAVGTFASKYCDRFGCKNGEIDNISKKLAESLKHCKAATKKDEERILYVLKGIGNTHHLTSGITTSLTECFAQGRSNRLRVAALQAFASAGCDANLQKKAIEILADRNEDSELRIEAFLAAIKCPNGELANEIAEILNSETVHQVGGFVTSTLRTIRDSTDEEKELQRRHLGNIRVTKKFPIDLRRYSYNDELSYKMDALGASASADYKLIYSQNGFLPRSARLNVKAEEHGINLNILEASYRQENLENVLEYFLGPKGLANKDLGEILSKEYDTESHRSRRSIADDSNKVAKKYKPYGAKNVNDLNLDLSLKLFGSEILFLSLGDNIPSSFDEIAKEFTEGLKKVKKDLTNYNREFSSHNFFMDTEMVFPTGVGVSLELVSDGFMANKLDFGVGVDIENLMQNNWYNSKYKIKFVPSVDINVNLKFGFNALVLTSGLRSVFTMHTATGSSVDVTITHEGAGFDMNVELPREKLELVDFKMQNDFYVGEQDKPVKSIPLKINKAEEKTAVIDSCYNELESLGFTLCIAGSGFDSNLEKTLTEPFDFSVSVLTEPRLNLKGFYNDQRENVFEWKLDYSTPGSKEKHDTSLTVELGSKPRYYGRASVDSSRYHLAVETGLNNDDKEIVYYAQYEQDKDVKKSKIGFVKNGNEYRPVIEIKDNSGVVTNEINGYRVDGRVLVQKSEEQSRLNFENLQVTRKDNKENVKLNGWAELGPSSVVSELQLTSNEDTVFIKSKLKVSGGDYAAGLFVNDVKTPENIYGASADVSVGDQSVNVEVVSKFAKWEASSSNAVQFVKEESSDAIAFSKFVSAVNIKHKQNSVGSLKVHGLTEGQNKFEVNVDASSGKKIAAIAVKYAANQKAPNDYQLSVNAKLNQHFLDIASKCDVVGNHFNLDNVLTTSWGAALTLKGELGQRYSPQDIYVDFQGSAQLNGKDQPIKWILKIIGAPEKTNTEFKVSRDNSEIIKVLADTQHPQDKITSGKVNVVVKNIVSANGDIKLAKNGKGDITVIIETLKTEPKHKIELSSKFQVQHPKYDVEANLIFDGEQKFHVKSENTIDKLKFNSKNEVEAAEKKILFDANASIKGDWRLNGEVQGLFTFTCPEGRVFSGSLKRKMNTNVKTGIAQGHVEAQLVDQLPNGGNKRTVALNGKLEKLNLKSRELAATSQFKYTSFESQTLDVDWHIKKLPKGQNKMIDFGTIVKGSLLKSPIEVTFAVDEYSVRHAIFKLGANYGDVVTGKINGNYDLGDRGTPMKYEVHSSVQVPNTSFKALELIVKGQFMEPETEGGNYIFEMLVDERAGNEQFAKLNANIKNSEKNGVFSFNLHTNKMSSPLEIDGSYTSDHTGTFNDDNASGSVKYDFNFKFGEKFLKSTNALSFNGKETLVNRFTVTSSFEGAKELEVEVKWKLVDPDTFNVKVNGKHGDQSYNLDTFLFRGTHKKGVELVINLPNNKPIKVVSVLEVIGRRKGKSTVELSNVLDLDFKFNGEGSYNAIDDFYVIGQWNSAKLGLDNYELDLRTQGKTLSVLLKNAQGEIISGTIACALKKENILEGQGQIKYKGAPQNTNFRLTRQVYELATDKEVGYSYNFNGNFGPKNGVFTFKITNKDFNIKLSLCEEKKQCTYVQIMASNDITQDESSIHSLLVMFDLREIGFPYEFELQSKNVREGFKFQYLLDSSINANNNLKYNLLVSLQATNAKFQLKLPSREILLEANQKYPTNGQVFGHYENSIAFFIDKINKPQDVTRFVAQADLTGKEHVALNAQGLLKLEHPTIRPLTVSSKLDANFDQYAVNSEVVFDLFKLPEQQIIATSQLKNLKSNHGFNITSVQVVRSSGLDFEYTLNSHAGLNTEQYEFSSGVDLTIGNPDLKASALVFGNKEHAEVLIYSLNEEIIRILADYNKHDKAAKLNAKLQVLGRKPLEINGELRPTSAKINLVRDGLLNAQGEFKLGKEFKFQVEGTGKELINGRVGLDSVNFLRTTYTANAENINEFMEKLENELKQDADVTPEVKKRFEKLKQYTDRQVQLYKDSIQDFSQLKNSYQNQITEIVKELEVDPAFKQVSEALQNIYTKFAKFADELTKLLSETYEKLCNSYASLYEKYQAILKETFIPAWEEFSTNVSKIVRELRLEIVRLYSRTLRTVLDVFKQYEPALRNYGKTVAEAFKPFNEAAQKLYQAIATAVEDLVNEWIEFWTNLPSFEAIQNEIKEKLQALQLSEKALELINNLFDQLHVLPLTAEVSDFFQKFHEYIVAKFKHEQVDDEKLVEELVKLLAKAIRSVWASLEIAAPAGASATGLSLHELFSNAPIPDDLFGELPALLTFRSSILNFLINEDWENWFTKESFSSFVVSDNFKLKGHFADGRHVFTFDGQHIHFTGNCKYILAQDSVDNNFTVIVQVNNGKAKSIFLTDREGQFMEINDSGTLKINGNAVEYPQHVNGMHAWRLFYTVYMFSEYGVQITCTTDLKICHVDVDGFYTSKTRGLLGNGNAEPYDDLLQIDGSIANDAATFINGYGLGKCNPVTVEPQTKDENSERTEICNELFGYDSILAVGYLFIDPKPYRNACDQNVLNAADKDKEQAGCYIATAYASALKLEDVFVFLPKQCLKCSGQAGQRELGEEFTLKVPSNKADLVFVVDLDVAPIVMQNLVAPVVTEVREVLKSRGFTDIQIGVVAYSANQRYPAILTSDNGKLNYQGNLADVKLNGPKPVFESSISQMITEKKVLDIFELLESIIKSIVPQPDEEAFRTALNYPFRAGSAKSIIVVRSNTLEYDNMLKFVRAHLTGAVTQFDAALLHVIGPVKDLALKDVSAEKIIGFNSRLVAMLDGKDAKKRAKLEFHNDMGIDFVLNNGGWVFGTHNFEKLQAPEQKKAVNQITTSLADTLFKTEIVTDCRCLPVHGIHAQHKCIIKSSNFVPNKKVKA